LFLRSLGIPDVTDNWVWQNCDNYTARKKLDDFVSLRGSIAHRLIADKPVHKSDGVQFFAHVDRLASLVDASVKALLNSSTGKAYW
jgi:hypothetical protein